MLKSLYFPGQILWCSSPGTHDSHMRPSCRPWQNRLAATWRWQGLQAQGFPSHLDSYGEAPHHQTQWPFSIANGCKRFDCQALCSAFFIGALLHEVTLKSHGFPELSLVNRLILHVFLFVSGALPTPLVPRVPGQPVCCGIAGG